MHRRTLNWMGDRHKDPHREMHLDGIGGVSILVKASVHRSGQSTREMFSLDLNLCCPNCLGYRYKLPLLRL